MATGGEGDARLRALPRVDRVIELLSSEGSPPVVGRAARTAVDRAREKVISGEATPTMEEIVADARSDIARQRQMLLGPVINATGVLVHTNLGRVPLGEAQLRDVVSVARNYSNLEYSLDEGQRGSRYEHARRLITALTGAESALVVNNNAAAVLLVLSALCSAKEVIISRGELIEIGGEFRLPDIMAAANVRLREVGTTNRTHLSDYERAISPETAAIMKVHPSNYRMVGFTATVDSKTLARLARGRGVMYLNDVGSGLIAPAEGAVLPADEPLVEQALHDGADIVTFSGDKLLGGPQAGVIAGRARLIGLIERHPLVRAMRVDKMTLAALQATLTIYLEGRADELPLWRMLTASTEDLRTRAEHLAHSIEDELSSTGVKAEVVPSEAVAGGGSLPGSQLASLAVAVSHPERSASNIAARLRAGDPPVVGRIEDDVVLIDMRAVLPDQDGLLTRCAIRALKGD
jgi:L-seryl-tRNA(Ser) seleniumtransferase